MSISGNTASHSHYNVVRVHRLSHPIVHETEGSCREKGYADIAECIREQSCGERDLFI